MTRGPNRQHTIGRHEERLHAKSSCPGCSARCFSPRRAQRADPDLPYDHIHLNVPDTAAAANWYEKNFGGKRITEAPDRIMYGSTRFMFLQKRRRQAERRQRHRSHRLLGRRSRRQDEGVRSRPASRSRRRCATCPGSSSSAFVEDPWGTRIEVVQDPELLGLHHIHMRGPNPDEGVRVAARQVRRRDEAAEGTHRRACATTPTASAACGSWCTKGEAEPSIGHAIDHIGWRSVGPLDRHDQRPAREGRRSGNASRVRCRCRTARRSTFRMLRGPAGARIELVETAGAEAGPIDRVPVSSRCLRRSTSADV